MLRPVSDKFSTGLDFHTYHLAAKLTFYDEQVAKHIPKWPSRLQVQMKAQKFDPMEPISMLGLSQAHEVACDHKRIDERAAIWFSAYVMKK